MVQVSQKARCMVKDDITQATGDTDCAGVCGGDA